MTTPSTEPAELDLERVFAVWSDVMRFARSSPKITALREEAKRGQDATPFDVVYREHSITLRRYRRGATRSDALPLLLVPSLVNRSYILDMGPKDSLVEYLVGRGTEVFLLDWGAPNPGQCSLDLAAYLNHYMDRVIRRVEKISGQPCHLLGYCLGGTMVALYLATHPGTPVASFIAMTTPVNFVDEGILSWWSRPEHLDVDRLVGALGNVPQQFFSATFPWISPTAPLKKLRTLFERQDDPEFLKGFLAIDIWLADSVPFPGEVYRQVVRQLYQENRMVEGTMEVGGRLARLDSIHTPLLNLVAKYDHVAPCESCRVLSDKVSSSPRHTEVLEAGHLGPALGRDARGKKTTAYWEMIENWMNGGWER